MALAVTVDVSFDPLSVRTLGTQAVVVQPETIAKLIEQRACRGHGRIGRSGVYVQAQLIARDDPMNHGVSKRRPGYPTCVITPAFRQTSINSR